MKPYQRKEMAQQLLVIRGVSIRLACHAFKGSKCCYLNQPIMSSQNEEIADWLMQLTGDDLIRALVFQF
jgi:putative transposase